MKSSSLFFAMGFCSLAHGVACPFADLRRSGMLSVEDAAKFDDVKRNPAAAEEYLSGHKGGAGVEKEKRQDLLGGLLDLPLGGGLCKYLPKIKKERSWLTTNLVNGALLPLTGVLAGIDIPTPQAQGLAEIPGNDPNHQFQAPGPTDVRGLCPTLNTLANHGYISRDGVGTRQSRCKKMPTNFLDHILRRSCQCCPDWIWFHVQLVGILVRPRPPCWWRSRLREIQHRRCRFPSTQHPWTCSWLRQTRCLRSRW
jgi:hypothetical protein